MLAGNDKSFLLPPDFIERAKTQLGKKGRKKITSLSEDSLQKIAETTLNQFKAEQEKEKEREKQQQEESRVYSKIEEMANTYINKNKPASVKLQEKAMKYWDKYVIKGKFFTKTLDLLKAGLQKTGSFLLDLFKGLLFLALFDPKGELAVSLINLLVTVFEFAIDLLVKMIPRLLNAIFIAAPKIVKALWDAFWKIAPKIGELILNTIKLIFVRAGEEFNMPWLKDLGEWIGNIGEKAKTVIGVIALIGGILAKFGLLAKAFALLSNPVGWIIAGIAALTAIFIYAEDIVSFFEDTFKKFANWFQKLDTKWKVLIVVLSMILWPITLLIGVIYGLAKAFAFLKSVDWTKLWGSIKDFFSGFIYGLINIPIIAIESLKKISKTFIINFIKIHLKLFAIIKNAVISFFQLIKDKWNWIKNIVQNVFGNIKTAIKSAFSFEGIQAIVDSVFGEGFTMKIAKAVIEAFGSVKDFFSAFVMKIMGLLSSFTGTGKEYKGFTFSELQSAAKLSRLSGQRGREVSTEQVLAYTKASKATSAEEKQAILREAGVAKSEVGAIEGLVKTLSDKDKSDEMLQELKKLNQSRGSLINLVPVNAGI